jgi:hypothetical protein
MAPELQKYFESYFDLFLTDGWKQFMEDVKESADSFNLRHVENESGLKFAQGQLLILDRLINWEAGIRNTYDTVQEEEKEEE